MKTLVSILLLAITTSLALAWPQQDLLIVNGSPPADNNQKSVQEEEEPFIVVAAAVENDGSSDPNEAFIPTKNDDDESNGDRPAFNLLSQEDLAREELGAVVIEAAATAQEGPTAFIPTNDAGAGEAGFKLLTKEDLAREEDYDQVIIVEANDDDEQPRLLDIPRDTSAKNEPFFKLPLPDEGLEDEYDDVVVLSAIDDQDEQGRTLAVDIPRDTSGSEAAGFRLPLADDDEDEARLPKKIEDLDDVVIIEVGDDEVDCFEERDPGSCLNSHEAWFYDPTHNKCHFFIYSGCGGNTNRFFSEDDCIATCKDAKKKKCNDSAPICDSGCALQKDENGCLTCNCIKKDSDVQRCLQEAKTGLCKALLKYWYYNADRQACEEFTYGGCEAGSSPNKFRTKELCQAACSGVSRPSTLY